MLKSLNTFKWYDNLWAAFIFFTRLPFWRLRQPPQQSYAAVVEWWPLTGWLTAAVMAATLYFGSMILPYPIVIILAIVIRLLTTGALHEDGLADFFDGFGGGGSDRERILTIMKDSHIGTFGVLSLIVYFSLLVTCQCGGTGNFGCRSFLQNGGVAIDTNDALCPNGRDGEEPHYIPQAQHGGRYLLGRTGLASIRRVRLVFEGDAGLVDAYLRPVPDNVSTLPGNLEPAERLHGRLLRSRLPISRARLLSQPLRKNSHLSFNTAVLRSLQFKHHSPALRNDHGYGSVGLQLQSRC